MPPATPVTTSSSLGEPCRTVTSIQVTADPGRSILVNGDSDRLRQVVWNLTLHGMRILVVDDEADARELLRLVLESVGSDVSVAASADDALRALNEQSFDVLLAGIAMPEMDGHSLLRAVRTLPTQAGRIPAIAVTAYASAADRELALNVGFNGHIAKPVDPTRLVAAVAALQTST